MNKILIPLFAAATLLVGCVHNSTESALEVGSNQVELRQIQSRAFDTTDKSKTMRTVISTLQDLGFVIDKADLELGTVSATKLDGYSMRMTVSVRQRGNREIIVRANAQFNDRPVLDPQPYQSFFVALERSIFLSSHSVD